MKGTRRIQWEAAKVYMIMKLVGVEMKESSVGQESARIGANGAKEAVIPVKEIVSAEREETMNVLDIANHSATAVMDYYTEALTGILHDQKKDKPEKKEEEKDEMENVLEKTNTAITDQVQ